MKKSILILIILTFLCGVMNCTTTKKTSQSPQLTGTWQLNYISGKRIAFEGLYPNRKPEITFDLSKKEITGNSSCNGFGCKYEINENSINFGDAIGTMMACDGTGEQDFYQMLKKVNRYSSDGTTLNLLIDDVAVMRFSKM